MNIFSSTTGSTNQLIVTSDGKLAINGVSFGEEAKPYERLFGMTEDEIYKKFGLIFKETGLYHDGQPTYEIESDQEAELYLIKKGFLKYVKGKSKWHDQAMDEGWKNGWTPNPDSVVEKKKELGHVYFFFVHTKKLFMFSSCIFFVISFPGTNSAITSCGKCNIHIKTPPV